MPETECKRKRPEGRHPSRGLCLFETVRFQEMPARKSVWLSTANIAALAPGARYRARRPWISEATSPCPPDGVHPQQSRRQRLGIPVPWADESIPQRCDCPTCTDCPSRHIASAIPNPRSAVIAPITPRPKRGMGGDADGLPPAVLKLVGMLRMRVGVRKGLKAGALARHALASLLSRVANTLLRHRAMAAQLQAEGWDVAPTPAQIDQLLNHLRALKGR